MLLLAFGAIHASLLSLLGQGLLDTFSTVLLGKFLFANIAVLLNNLGALLAVLMHAMIVKNCYT